jgi:hypothetical protein
VDGVETEFADFVDFCKFVLCTKTSTLFKDPIWESYTDEEIIIEYYSHLYHGNEEEASAFRLGMGIDDLQDSLGAFAEWAESQEENNKKELEETFEENVSFAPDEES